MVAYFQRVVPQLTFASNQLNKGVARHHTAAKLHHHHHPTTAGFKSSRLVISRS